MKESEVVSVEVKRVCGWCGEEMGTITVDVPVPEECRVTHGICRPCYDAQMEEIEVPMPA